MLRCFYAFLEIAPEGFVEREYVRTRVKRALLDPDFKKKVKKVKKIDGVKKLTKLDLIWP